MLIAFEAAARLSSFSKAGEELNVTQPAVSRQIRMLEAFLGVQLFVRRHRSIELTQTGAGLSRAMSRSLAIIGETIDGLRALGPAEELVITALPAFSNLWLAPRLSAFHALHPNLSVRVIAHERDCNLADGDIDVALRFGQGTWSDGKATFLYHDRIFPVCSAAYLEGAGLVEGLDELVQTHLIGYDQVERDWVGWNDWLAACGYEGPPVRAKIQYSNYPDAIFAAIDGQGIALGWQALVEPYLRNGQLVRLDSPEVVTRSAHFAVCARRNTPKPSVHAFILWLQSVVLQAGLTASPLGSRSV
jgi:DNA-binding transcriptional LysR family regulator